MELEKKVSLLLIVKLEQNRSRRQVFIVIRDGVVEAPFAPQRSITERGRGGGGGVGVGGADLAGCYQLGSIRGVRATCASRVCAALLLMHARSAEGSRVAVGLLQVGQRLLVQLHGVPGEPALQLAASPVKP